MQPFFSLLPISPAELSNLYNNCFTMTASRRLYFTLLAAVLLLASCKSKENSVPADALFTAVPAASTHIDFENKIVDKDMFNILYYLYYYNGGGVAIGDINNDGLPDLYFTANTHGNNKLYLNKGNLSFEDITTSAGVAGNIDWSSGVTMADVNGDGFLDIYVTASSQHHNLKGHNELYINSGKNTFTESAEQYGLAFSGFGTQAAFFDFDHDGDLDVYLLNHSQKPNSNILDTAFRRKYDPMGGDRLMRNDLATTGKFTDVSAAAGIYQSSLGYGLGIAIADFNNDGWEDIYIGNDFHENDYYYINNHNGTFTESGEAHFRHYSRFSMGNDAADFNNDGQIDVVTVDMLPPDEKTLKTYGSDEHLDTYNFKLMGHGYQNQFSRNCLQRNNGSGISFSETGLQSGIAATDWSWSPLLADFDNDGNKDLFISSGIVKRPVDLDYVKFVSDLVQKMDIDKTNAFDLQAIEKMPDGASHPFFFKGSGGIGFTDVSNQWGTGDMKGYFNGSSYADLDNDGDLDLVMNCINQKAVVLKNNSANTRSLTLTFKGDGKNTSGIGAKAYLFTKDSSGAPRLQFQQLMTTRGFQSATETRLHFGLGNQATADSILVVWPDQRFELVRSITAGKPLTFLQKNAGGVFDYNKFFLPTNGLLTEVQVPDGNWRHIENDLKDFNVQYLIPHVESTRGPKIAVADVNGDGLDDIYACGAKGQPGTLLIRQSNGSFQPADTAVFAPSVQCEDVDAVFFDANGDKHPDLLVVSGGNEVLENGRQGQDRLYINDGKGHFTLKEQAFPEQYENKSCVAVADVDHDGDLDFFIGNLSSVTAYGKPMNSYLYLNKGDATFDLATAETIFLQNIGMVTSAAFADLDGDSWPELIVTGEWMPVKIFRNNKGHFEPYDLPASTGLWQTLLPADVNGDGKTDLLAGNWGQNSKLYAGKSGPLKLYVKDFDNNGSMEQLMCYTINGKEYTFLAKDELERSMPVLKKAYLTYSEVAGETVQFMMNDLFKDYAELKAEVLSSSVFINDGKGGFVRQDLPAELQLAPLMRFSPFGPPAQKRFIAGGNFYGVLPYEGRYDAMLPVIFQGDARKGITVAGVLPGYTSEIRDLQWVKSKEARQQLVIASNNGPLRFFEVK